MKARRCGLTGLLMLLLLVSRSRGGVSDVRNRAIDFFSLLKNHLVPQRAAVSADASPAHRTEVHGNCLHEYYAIHPRQPLTITSTNYPGPYPPSECRKMLLVPTDQHTSVVLVCTDIDTFAIGVLGEVSGDMLEFPGGVVNRRVHTMYGIDVTQCAAVPFTRRTPPGQALKVGFFSDEFVQRRGFSCQAWGEAVDEAERLRPANVGAGGAASGTDQDERQQQQQQLQHQEASQIHQQGAQVHNRQPNQQAQHQAQHQQFQPQQVQHHPQHQNHQEQQVVFQQHQHQDEEQVHPFSQSPAFAIGESFAQVMPLLRLHGYRPFDQQRRPLGSAPRPQRPPQFAGLQAFADLFGGGRRRVRGGSNRTGRRVRGPHRPTGHVRFPGRRHRRSLADLLKKRLLLLQARDRDVTVRPSTTTTTTLPSVVSGQSGDEPLEAAANVGAELGVFKPPEHVEYLFTPLRKPPPFDPERVGNPPMFLRVPITQNTTESPLIEVPYVVTPQTITLRATTDAGQVLTRLLDVGKDTFPTTPKPGSDGYKTSRPNLPTSPQVLPERLQTKRKPVTTAPQGVLERIDVTDGFESNLEDDKVKLEGNNGVVDNAVVVPVSDDPQSLDEDFMDPGSDVEAPDDGALPDGESIGHGDRIVVEGVTEDNERVVEEMHAPDVVDATGDPSSGTGHAVQDGHVEGEDSIDCGVAGPAIQGRVFGGEDALPGNYPWVVYLISDAPLGPEKTVYCTGSLISLRWILTAAHCVDYARTTDVHMGYLDVSKATNLTLRVNATKYRVHRYWTRLAKDHDLALIELPEEVTVSESVRPICLPRRSQVGNTYEDARAEICGWGKTYTDQVGGSFVLQRAEVAVRSNCDCMASFPISVTPLKICSHGRFHSPCQGDSGGPLQVRGVSGRYTLVGVSSFTSSLGCDVGMPAIYTRVTAYLDWIEENSDLVVPL